MTESPGISLSLLEGMDETLLVRLHDSGIHSREGLEPHLATPAKRRDLAARLVVSALRIEALYELNFVLPEERTARLLRAEQRMEERLESLATGQRTLWRGMMGLTVGLFVVLLIVLFTPGRRPAGPGVGFPDASAQDSALQEEIAGLRERLDALAPLARAQAEAELHAALEGLGPAPGWSGPLTWDAEHHRRLRANLDDDPAAAPLLAVSLALRRLAEIENAPPDSLSPLQRARAARDLVLDFPPVGKPQTLWDSAAFLVRLRLVSRALGGVPLEDDVADPGSPCPWSWTAPGFLEDELLLARLENLPLREGVLRVWSETLVAMRHPANEAREALGDKPEAWAREYWLRRGEIEFAVAGAIVGARNLMPYAEDSPRELLDKRRAYLERALSMGPREALGPLAWLTLELEEADRAVAWLEATPGAFGAGAGKPWLEAVSALDTARAPDTASQARALLPAVTRALEMSGLSPDAGYAAPRTRWEAGLRPLLMTCRAAGRAPRDPSLGP